MKTEQPKESPGAPRVKQIAANRRARHEYTVLDTFEAGIVLQGTEVKSLRAGMANLADSYADFQGSELFLLGANISPYDHGNRWNRAPRAPRKLLLRRAELKRLYGKVATRGLTLVPLSLYFKGSRVKVELALVQGKKLHDKRETIRRRDQQRDMAREMRERRKA